MLYIAEYYFDRLTNPIIVRLYSLRAIRKHVFYMLDHPYFCIFPGFQFLHYNLKTYSVYKFYKNHKVRVDL